MGLEVTQCNFEDLTLDYDLRVDSKFYPFALKRKFNFLPSSQFSLIKLKEILESDYSKFEYKNDEEYKGLPTSGEYFDEDGDIIKFQLVTKENHPERLRFESKKGQILISSLKGAAAPAIFIDESKEGLVVSNGFYILRVKNESAFLTDYIYHLLKSKIMREILDEHLSRGIGISSYKELDLLRIKIPDSPIGKQKVIVKKIKEIESRIKELKKELRPLQEIIDEIFINFNLKSPEKSKRNEFEVFQTDLDNISRQKFLRNGPLYRSFWDVHNGLLFSQNKSKYHLVKLGKLIKLHKTKTLRKGILDQEYILLDLEDIESMTGRISNEDKLITEIGSDKTLFGDSDIIISKIDPYLGYTFLNDVSKPYIGTTELLPFKVEREKALSEFIKYLLLSKDYIKKSGLLMYGKRHPRIHIIDLLDIRVPCPDLSTQKEIVEEISEEEERNFQAQERIKKFRKDIEDFLWNSLSER